ncbi:hypothetical protein WICPIJ_006222 [Wickerhamomyces pijperi]|uniref:Nop domain-containing protein n=1 Tax=Wickerhamomyces pijperi TaxID=599730 RepID=A0A9P8TL29_WICPI|nr:hypothetical protein WICPIJ_006222 [Wickerhamomyces pijperi]
MSLDQALLDDLDSDFGSSDEQQQELQETEVDTNNIGQIQGIEEEQEKDQLNQPSSTTFIPLDRIQIDQIQDITDHTAVSTKLQPVLSQIHQYLSNKFVSKQEESQFLITVNALSLEITNEIIIIHNFIKLRYQKRYPELETLVPNAIEYAKLVQIFGNELKINEDSLYFLGKEKLLMLTMSTHQAQTAGTNLTETQLTQLNKACELLISLEESKRQLLSYISDRLTVLAPNLTAIVGPTVSSQLITILGGLEGLAKTPSCNIPSLGSKSTVGSLTFGRSGSTSLVNEGYLFHSDLVQDMDPSFRKQAMRMIAGKVILAARIDFSGSIPDGSQGLKWRKEVESKVEKLGEAPENSKIKALPVPKDMKAKKRAGRKVRKLKAKFELSELRKAQNVMMFGQRENTVTDAYGEEIGLGITNGNMAKIPVNVNNKAKVTKNMKGRLEKSRIEGKLTEDIFNQDFINLPAVPSVSQGKKQ